MRAQAQLGRIYEDLRALRKKVADLEPTLPSGLTARQLQDDLDSFEESLGTLILNAFDPPRKEHDAA